MSPNPIEIAILDSHESLEWDQATSNFAGLREGNVLGTGGRQRTLHTAKLGGVRKSRLTALNGGPSSFFVLPSGSGKEEEWRVAVERSRRLN